MRKNLENLAYVAIFLKKTTKNFCENFAQILRHFMKFLKNFEENKINSKKFLKIMHL